MGPDKFQNITAILFDLDNTLINTKAAHRIACEQVFHYLLTDGVRRPVARDVVDQFHESLRDLPEDPSDPRGDRGVDTWRLQMWRRTLGPGLSARAHAASSVWREAHAKALRPAPGLEDLLLGLRGRYKLGLLAGNGSPRAQRDKIERTGLSSASGLFDALSVGGDSGKAAPSTAAFEEVFRKLDTDALECAMVSGRPEVAVAAVRANCGVTVWLLPPDTERRAEEDFSPDFVISDLRSLPDILPERRGFASLSQDRRLGLFHSLRDEGWTSVV